MMYLSLVLFGNSVTKICSTTEANRKMVIFSRSLVIQVALTSGGVGHENQITLPHGGHFDIKLPQPI